jgi:Ca2+-dependent lipid-binding protein
VIIAKESLSEKLKPSKMLLKQEKVESKPEKSEIDPTIEEGSKIKTWLNKHGSEFGISMSLCLLVYFVGFFQFSFLYVLIPIVCTYWHQNRKEVKKSKVTF